jgi:hypothetical protein
MTHCRYVHLSKDDVELEVLQAKFLPAFSTAPHHQGAFCSDCLQQDSTRKESERDAAEAAGAK